MLSLLTAPQIRQADAYTLAHGPLSSIDLMERASTAFVDWFVNQFPDRKQKISVYCGTGNNGGDGLAIARLLAQLQYDSVKVKVARFFETESDGFTANFKRLKQSPVVITEIFSIKSFLKEEADIIIDALLGSGVNKPLEGEFKELVIHINELQKTVVAVDVPTGLLPEGRIDPDAVVLKTDLAITFQQPKITFLLPESASHLKKWKAVDIGIDEAFILSLQSPFLFVEESDIRKKLKPRRNFSNKGTYGHALIVAGKAETMGAAIVCAAGCAYSGAGLTTACIPQSGLTALNSYLPEIMAMVRNGTAMPSIKWDSYNTIGIGPGLGQEDSSLNLFKNILDNYKKPLVIDADALNLLAENKDLLTKIPINSILTPHMKEFDRLFGDHNGWWERIQTGVLKAAEFNIYILLKNDYTIVITPAGKVYFNATSNPAMATGGMGDVLTGIITSLLAQKYPSEDACVIGAYIHGKAGDELALNGQANVILPGRLAAHLPVTMAKLIA